jgi:predicted transcriptional regulator
MDAIPDFRRDVLVSIRPLYASKILIGHKTVELRRKFPEHGVTGATAFIYSSSPVGAVVACARIKHVLKLPVTKIWKEHGDAACISKDEFDAYFHGLKFGFAIFFASVKSLKQELKAADLLQRFGIVPPQSYRYLTEECAASLIDEPFQTADRYKRRNRARRLSARPVISC